MADKGKLIGMTVLILSLSINCLAQEKVKEQAEMEMKQVAVEGTSLVYSLMVEVPDVKAALSTLQTALVSERSWQTAVLNTSGDLLATNGELEGIHQQQYLKNRQITNASLAFEATIRKGAVKLTITVKKMSWLSMQEKGLKEYAFDPTDMFPFTSKGRVAKKMDAQGFLKTKAWCENELTRLQKLIK